MFAMPLISVHFIRSVIWYALIVMEFDRNKRHGHAHTSQTFAQQIQREKFQTTHRTHHRCRHRNITPLFVRSSEIDGKIIIHQTDMKLILKVWKLRMTTAQTNCSIKWKQIEAARSALLLHSRWENTWYFCSSNNSQTKNKHRALGTWQYGKLTNTLTPNRIPAYERTQTHAKYTLSLPVSTCFVCLCAHSSCVQLRTVHRNVL